MSATNELKFIRSKHDQFLSMPENIDALILVQKFDVFPLRMIRENGRSRLLLAMLYPHRLDRIADIEFYLGISIIPVAASRSDLTYLEQAARFRQNWTEESTDLHEREKGFSPTEEKPFKIEDWT